MPLLKTKPYRFQRRAIRFALKERSVALFMEQGTGKTLVALAVAARLWQRGYVDTILVLAPRAVLIGWARQAKQHLNIPIRVWTGKKALRGAEQGIGGQFEGITLVSINYELLWRRSWLVEYPWDMVIADESHRIKRHNSKQSEAAAKLQGEYRLALTGTPIEKDERDLWAQFRFVDPEILGTNWWGFVQKYCRKILFGDTGMHKWDITKSNKKKVRDLTALKTFRAKARDVLELPPVIHQGLYFELEGGAGKAYREMEDGMHTEWGDQDISAHLEVTRLLRLKQLTGGFLSTDDGQIIQLEQDKLNIFLDYLHDVSLEQKIVVFAQFTEEINILREAISKTTREVDVLDGSTKDQGAVWTRFQDDESMQAIILQNQSGGVGIELFASHLCFIYSSPISWIDYDQMLKRLDRNGQTHPVTFLHLLAENTIDEDNLHSLEAKGQTTDTILNYMHQRRSTMSKTDKKEKKSKPTPPKIEKPDHGVDQLAAEMKIDAATVRVKLRATDLGKTYKTGRAWDFKNAKNVKAVAKELAPKK